jgi:hypothetical protein
MLIHNHGGVGGIPLSYPDRLRADQDNRCPQSRLFHLSFAVGVSEDQVCQIDRLQLGVAAVSG